MFETVVYLAYLIIFGFLIKNLSQIIYEDKNDRFILFIVLIVAIIGFCISGFYILESLNF